MNKQNAEGRKSKTKREKDRELIKFPGGVTKSRSSHPRYPFVVRYPGPNGQRLTKYFTNDTEALLEAKNLSSEAGELGSSFGTISEDERAALARYRAFYCANDNPKPPALVEIVREFAKRWEASRGGLTVGSVVEKYLSAKRAEGLKKISIAALETRCGRFAKDFGQRPIASIESGELSDWILGLKSTRTRRAHDKQTKNSAAIDSDQVGLLAKKNYRLALSGLFNFAVARGWILESPVLKAAKPRPQKLQPSILRPGDVARLFGCLERHAPELVPFWAVRFFAGIRDQEALRMDWRMIDLIGGEIHLPDSVTKTGRSRTIKIEPVLDAFLTRYKQASGAVAPATESARRYPLERCLRALAAEDDEAAEKHKGKNPTSARFPIPMPANAARHSFATYHLLAGRHAGETSLQLGHGGSPELLHRHYRGIATEAEAKAFWAIRPAKGAVNVISFKNRDRAHVKWPDPEKLSKMMSELTVVQIARELGVSDSAVLKHARKVGISNLIGRHRLKN